jgi:hypothetical protein
MRSHLFTKVKMGIRRESAYLEQLAGLFLDSLAVVQKHHGAIRRHQGAVGVLGEVLVARSVEQVDAKCLGTRS